MDKQVYNFKQQWQKFEVRLFRIKIKKQEVMSKKEQLKVLGKLRDKCSYIKKFGSAQATKLKILLKILTEKKYL